MYPFLNIHTHRPDAHDGVCAVVCCEPSDFQDTAENVTFCSVGHHPWRVGRQSSAELAAMAPLLLQKRVVAVGEIGLDKVCDADFNLQLQIFKTQLQMAACVHKPVVVHCVRAWNELLQTLSQINDLPPIIVHGFRGKPMLAEQLLRRNCYLSFGVKYNVETLKNVPLGMFFLETDAEEDADIMELYERVSETLGVGLEQLKRVVYNTWQRVSAENFTLL